MNAAECKRKEPLKMFRRSSLVLFLILIITICQTIHAEEDRKLVRVFFETEQDIEKFKSYDMDFGDYFTRRYADVFVTDTELQLLDDAGFRMQTLIDDIKNSLQKAGLFAEDMGDYHTYQEMLDEMEETEIAFPTICKMISIGKSIEGRDIWAIKVSDEPELEDDSEPDLLYMANMHAREIITPEIILYFLNHLVSNYNIDLEITDFINHLEFWLIPTQNPDGHVYVEEIDESWRKNRRNNGDGTFGVDLNRNYGYMWGYDNNGSSPNSWSDTYRGPGPFSEPESQVIRDLCNIHEFVLSLSYHSYGNLWLFPWGYINEKTEDHDIFREIAKNCTDFNGYLPQLSAELYLANGDTDDYFYGAQQEKNKIYAFTPEVGTTFYPPEEEIPALVHENLEPNLYIARIAPIIASNPRKILRPATPALLPVSLVQNGQFTLEWTLMDDPDNPAISFEIQEFENIRYITDDIENNNSFWTLKGFEKSTARYHSQNHSLYSTSGDNLDHTAMLKHSFVVSENNAELVFWTWYDIERNWDYAYVEISNDGGESFNSIGGNLTTTYDPYRVNRGYGITGKSSGWEKAVFDLSDYIGETIIARIRYITDTYQTNEGIYIDDFNPVADFSAIQSYIQSSPETEYQIIKSDTGTYHYQVRSIDSDGQNSYWSSLIKVKLDTSNFNGSVVYVSPDTVSAYPDQSFDITIGFVNNPSMIDTFGLVLSYDPSIMTYIDYKYDLFNPITVSEVDSGKLNIVGFTDTPVAENNSGELIQIFFVANEELYESRIIPEQFEFDIESMASQEGLFVAPPCLLGDVNYDGMLTPGDALYAFNMYLHYFDIINNVYPLNQCALENADIDCTPNGITPGDALNIFRAYLNGDELPLKCIESSILNYPEEITIRLKRGERISNEIMSIPISISCPDSISAFGITVNSHNQNLKFHSLQKSDITMNWDYLNASQLSDGSVRIGGFSEKPIRNLDDTNLCYLQFVQTNSSNETSDFEITELTDDFTNATIEIVTSTEQSMNDDALPRTLALEQNYPNPFNMQTTIRYQLPEKSFVELIVYNSIGAMERVLVKSEQNAGTHQIHWDGRNDYGNHLSSGLYFYRLKNNNTQITRKLILLK